MSVALDGTFLTTEEAAEHVGVSPGRIRQFLAEKRLQAELVCGSRFFRRDEVLKFAKKQRKVGRPKNPKK